MENRIPCKPFAMMRVLRPRPKRPRMPSCSMTSLAASATHHTVSFAGVASSSCELTVGYLGVVDLTVGLNHPQGVRYAVRYHGGAEADESQTG